MFAVTALAMETVDIHARIVEWTLHAHAQRTIGPTHLLVDVRPRVYDVRMPLLEGSLGRTSTIHATKWRSNRSSNSNNNTTSYAQRCFLFHESYVY